MEDFTSLARRRRSIHEFTPKPVEYEKIIEVIRAGGYAPSVGDLQMWRFIIITDDATKASIVGVCPQQEWMHSAPVLIVLTSDVGKTTDYYNDYADRWCSQSCAACVQNMLLAATDLGLGSCWVGSYDAESVRDALKIPDGFRPEAILALGYSDETPSEKVLRPLDQCVFFNGFGAKLESLHSTLRDWGDHFRGKHEKATKNIKKDAGEKARTLKDKFHGKMKDVLEKSNFVNKKK